MFGMILIIFLMLLFVEIFKSFIWFCVIIKNVIGIIEILVLVLFVKSGIFLLFLFILLLFCFMLFLFVINLNEIFEIGIIIVLVEF